MKKVDYIGRTVVKPHVTSAGALKSTVIFY